MQKNSEQVESSQNIKCPKCGSENSQDMKFCGNCGEKLGAESSIPELEVLSIIHITGSAYLLVSLIFNSLIQASIFFWLPYLFAAILGLYVGYNLYIGKIEKWLKILSVIAIISGLVSTSSLFVLIGLALRNNWIIGPAWVIFIINAWVLWKYRMKF